MSQRRVFRPATVEILEDRVVLAQGVVAAHGVMAFQATLPVTAQDPNLAYIQSLYTFVGRAPSPGGVASHEQELNSGRFNRFQVAMQFLNTPEFRNAETTYLFQQLLGRSPSATDLPLFNQYLSGKNHSIATEAALILGSAEFFNNAGGTNQGFINAVYGGVFGRAPDAASQAWVNALNNGASTRQVAGQILSTPEGASVLVAVAYAQVLQRSPDPSSQPYADYLARGGRFENVVAALLSSQEYYNGVQAGTLGNSGFAGAAGTPLQQALGDVQSADAEAIKLYQNLAAVQGNKLNLAPLIAQLQTQEQKVGALLQLVNSIQTGQVASVNLGQFNGKPAVLDRAALAQIDTILVNARQNAGGSQTAAAATAISAAAVKSATVSTHGIKADQTGGGGFIQNHPYVSAAVGAFVLGTVGGLIAGTTAATALTVGGLMLLAVAAVEIGIQAGVFNGIFNLNIPGLSGPLGTPPSLTDNSALIQQVTADLAGFNPSPDGQLLTSAVDTANTTGQTVAANDNQITTLEQNGGLDNDGDNDVDPDE